MLWQFDCSYFAVLDWKLLKQTTKRIPLNIAQQPYRCWDEPWLRACQNPNRQRPWLGSWKTGINWLGQVVKTWGNVGTSWNVNKCLCKNRSNQNQLSMHFLFSGQSQHVSTACCESARSVSIPVRVNPPEPGTLAPLVFYQEMKGHAIMVPRKMVSDPKIT